MSASLGDGGVDFGFWMTWIEWGLGVGVVGDGGVLAEGIWNSKIDGSKRYVDKIDFFRHVLKMCRWDRQV